MLSLCVQEQNNRNKVSATFCLTFVIFAKLASKFYLDIMMARNTTFYYESFVEDQKC